MASNDPTISTYGKRLKLHELINSGSIGIEVLDQLLPDGQPILYERALWDYKLKLPTPPISQAQVDLNNYEADICELIKDSVAFYNSYGGYIVAGIRDNPREVEGFDKQFNCDELNKKIRGYTGNEIETCYSIVECQLKDKKIKFGLLFIPQRPADKDVVQFKKDAKPSSTGKKAFLQKTIYFRSGDECKPAESPEDYAFLIGSGRRTVSNSSEIISPALLENNLGTRDPGFIRFIGREVYLNQLWEWLLDKYSPVKLLAGVGGVGKTAIAREFVELITKNVPVGFEKVIWLSAKKRYYTAVIGTYVPISRVDFYDKASLLKALLSDLGTPDSELGDDVAEDELISILIEALRMIPTFLVVDDLDSLEAVDQQDVFHGLIQVFSQTVSGTKRTSRALLTARLDLGAAPAQVTRVIGLNVDEFYEFIQMTSSYLSLNINFDKKSKQFIRFHSTCEGSPTFGYSILRLISLGDDLDSALNKWKGAEGEEVRRFAFEKELGELPDSHLRGLYAAVLLGETTAVELKLVLNTNDTSIKDLISVLRRYHLLSNGEGNLPGGARLSVPSSIRLMSDIIKAKLLDPKRIEGECARARSSSVKSKGEIGALIQRVVSLWKDGKPNDALDLATHLANKYKNDGELRCLEGRCYLKIDIPDYVSAEKSFRKANEIGCDRQEFRNLWIEAKRGIGDWVGVLEITKEFSEHPLDSEIVFYRCEAYGKMGEEALNSGSLINAANYFRLAGNEINNAFSKNKATGRVVELKQMKADFYQEYVRTLDRYTVDPNSAIDVWLAVVKCFDSYVRNPQLIRLGIARLMEWWNAVERRGRYDHSTEQVARHQVSTLLRIHGATKENKGIDPHHIEYIASAVEDLDKRVSKYNS